MLNLLARNKGSKRWLGLCLFAIAFLCVALVSGCGGSGSSGSGGGAPAKEYSNVIFHFNDLAGKTLARAVPDGTTQIRFTGSTSSREVLYGPTTRDYAPTITLEKVPVRVTGFVLECLNNKGGLTAIIPVSVTIDGYKDTVVTITESPALNSVVKNVVVNPTSINNLLVGCSESITAIATLSDGQIVDLTPYLTFTSSDPDVATVEQNGYDGAKVTASKGGQTTISGSVLGVTIPEIDVVVNGGVVADGIVFKPDKLEVARGYYDQSIVCVHFNDGSTKNLESAKVTSYKAETDGIVKVALDPAKNETILRIEGLTTASVKDTTKVIVTATLSDGSTQTAKMDVTIVDSVPVELDVTNDTTSGSWPADLGQNKIYINGEHSSSQFAATVKMSDGTSKPVTEGVTWISSNTTAAEFDATGLLTATGKSTGTTNVTASYNNVPVKYNGVASSGINMEVIEPGITKLEVVSGLTQSGEISLLLPYDSEGDTDLSEKILKLQATYGNGKVEYPSKAEGLECKHLIRPQKESSEDYLSFEDGDEEGAIKVSAKQETTSIDGEASWVQFTYKEVSTGEIPAMVRKDDVQDISMNLVDQTTNKAYTVDLATGYEIAVPYGRKYRIYMNGYTKGKKDVDLSDKYYYGFFVGYDKLNDDPKTTPTALISATSVDNPVIVSNVDTNADSPTKGWSKTNEISSKEDEYSVGLFDTTDSKRGNHRYKKGGGEIVLLARNMKTNEITYRVKLYFAEPAVDSYIVRSHGAKSRRGNDLTFDIPRGTSFDLSSTSTHQVIGVMSDIVKGGGHRQEDITGSMTIDDSSVPRDKFILPKTGAADYPSVDSSEEYASKNDYNADSMNTFDVVINNNWDEEDVFGHKSVVDSGSKWLSYNCENPGFIFRLERPMINSADLKVLDRNKHVVSPDAGKYHFKQDDVFYCYYDNPKTSDHQEDYYPNMDYIKTRENISQVKVMSTGSWILCIKRDEDAKYSKDPYRMSNTTEQPLLFNGCSSSITLTPEDDLYYDASKYNKTVGFVLDIP